MFEISFFRKKRLGRNYYFQEFIKPVVLIEYAFKFKSKNEIIEI